MDCQFLPMSREGRILWVLQLPLTAFIAAAVLGLSGAPSALAIVLILSLLATQPLYAGVAIRAIERRLERMGEAPSLFAHQLGGIAAVGALFATSFCLIQVLFRTLPARIPPELTLFSGVYVATTLACLLGFVCAARERIACALSAVTWDPY